MKFSREKLYFRISYLLEFKLLKFFIDNPDRIIEREEIIKAVWKDEKTTEGVTDQALDQLIFRLRKKSKTTQIIPNLSKR